MGDKSDVSIEMEDADKSQVDESLLDADDGDDGGDGGDGGDNKSPPAKNKTHSTEENKLSGEKEPTTDESDKSLPKTTSKCGTSTAADDGGLPKIYKIIRVAKRADMPVRTLGGCAGNSFGAVGSFNMDPRFSQANSRFSYHRKKNMTTSFDISTLTCNTCINKGGHSVLLREGENCDSLNQSPVCFVLTDQNFPPLHSSW
jgi:hypothetical protein